MRARTAAAGTSSCATICRTSRKTPPRRSPGRSRTTRPSSCTPCAGSPAPLASPSSVASPALPQLRRRHPGVAGTGHLHDRHEPGADRRADSPLRPQAGPRSSPPISTANPSISSSSIATTSTNRCTPSRRFRPPASSRSTMIALHDTGTHPEQFVPWAYAGPGGWIHQPVERAMSDRFQDQGYDCVHFHAPRPTGAIRFRHGLTLCMPPTAVADRPAGVTRVQIVPWPSRPCRSTPKASSLTANPERRDAPADKSHGRDGRGTRTSRVESVAVGRSSTAYPGKPGAI